MSEKDQYERKRGEMMKQEKEERWEEEGERLQRGPAESLLEVLSDGRVSCAQIRLS